MPWYARIFAACVVAYAFSPIDLIPDFVPVLGYLDDLLLETVRLLRSQLRTKSGLKVIETDVLPLTEIALQQTKEPAKEKDGLAPVPPVDGAATPAPGAQATDKPQAAMTLPTRIKDEKDLQAYDQIFANVGFWKKLGEEFQSPLIVTGVSSNARMLVIVSGPTRNGLACTASAQCLEDSANSDGNNTYVKPSRFPASNDRMALTCSTAGPCSVVP